MINQFMPYEHARMMKKCGFDEPCISYYDALSILKTISCYENEYNNSYFKNCNYQNLLSGPLFQQAEEWLWEKHKIWFKTIFGYYGYQYTSYFNGRIDKDFIHSTRNNSPILAKREGILKAIEYINKNHKAK